ncbi:hypothetical protein V8E36_007260 [Tilletia maclaganii]
MLLEMLHIVFFFSIVVLSSSITVNPRAPNETTHLHHNGTLDAEKVVQHLRYVQCRFQSTQTANHLCPRFSRLEKRRAGSIELRSASTSAAPVGELSIVGRPTLVVFDTAAPFSIFDPRTYNPELSQTAEQIGEPFAATFRDGRESQISRWRDFVRIGDIGARTTFHRAQEPIFDPTKTNAMGICALSRFGGLAGRPLSLIEEFSRADVIDRPVFAFALSRVGQTVPSGGWLFLGFHRRSVHFAALDSDPRYAGLWAVRGSLNEIFSTMVLDTVSTFIVLPLEQARSIFDSFGLVAEQYDSVLMANYHCAFPPVISITIGSSRITLSRDSVKLSVEEPNICTLSIVGQEQGHITLGLPFFRSAYVAFDLGGRVGRSVRPARVGIGRP